MTVFDLVSVYRRRTPSPAMSAGIPLSDFVTPGLTSGWTGNSYPGWKPPPRSPGRRPNRMRQYINISCFKTLQYICIQCRSLSFANNKEQCRVQKNKCPLWCISVSCFLKEWLMKWGWMVNRCCRYICGQIKFIK